VSGWAVSLRDVRRVMSTTRCPSYPSFGTRGPSMVWRTAIAHGVPFCVATDGRLIHGLSYVDQLVARLGPGFVLESTVQSTGALQRAKEDIATCATEASVSDAPTAGKDSYQAAPPGAERAGRGDEPRAGAERAEPSGEATQADSDGDSPRAPSPHADDAQSDAPAAMPGGAQGGAKHESAKTAKDGAQEGSDECAQSGDTSAGTEGIAHVESAEADCTSTDDSANDESTQSHSAAGSGVSSSRHSRAQHGGVSCDLSLRGRKQKLARRLRRELLRVLRIDHAPSGDYSPRVDARRLVREIASRRVALSRARKSEVSRELCVLAVDVSGSCSSFSAELWAAATAIAVDSGGDVIESDEEHVSVRSDAPVLAIAHSNGWVGQTSLADFALRLGRPLSTVIVLGDCDGAEHYRVLCERGQRLIWLDNYCARHEVARVSARVAALHEGWRRRPTDHLQGVGSGESALAALRLVRQ